MEIKGTAVKSIYNFVKERHKEKLQLWLDALPAEAKNIMQNPILATDWYDLNKGCVLPTTALKVLYNNDVKKAAWESGRFSADSALTGIYKVFIKVSSPNFIISRAGKIFETYYRPSKIEVVSNVGKTVNLHITEFPEPNKVIDYRIAGWMERALEINNCKNVRVNLPQMMSGGFNVTEFDISWE